MKAFLQPLALLASAVLLSAQAPAPAVSSDPAAEVPALAPRPAPAPSSDTTPVDAEQAPTQRTASAPSEAQLSPPPDAEKAPLPMGFVEVLNPAFPGLAPPTPVVHRGRRYALEDLSPYFGTGKKKEARDAFDRGFYAKARALLEGEGNSVPVRYLRALSAVRAGDDKAAATEMTALAADYPALKDRCLTHAGVALESQGRYADAAALLSQVGPESRLYVDARLGLARVLRKKKDLAGAMAALAPLTTRPGVGWGRNVGAEALIATADLAVEKKDRAAEREALWRLWATQPLSPLAKQAEKRLKGVTPPLEAKVARAEQFLELNRNKQGLTLLEPLLPQLKLPDTLACRAHFAFGKGQRKERQHTRAIQVLTPVVEKCQDRDLLARALYVLGSSRSIVDQARGTETYERLAREFPDHSFADDALFYAADLYVKTSRPKEAMARLDELARLYPRGDFLGEALFKAFWIARTSGAEDGGFAFLDRIEAQFGNADESYDVERARYWRARTLQERGNLQGAAEMMERLAVEHPATYYGLMARSQLATLDPKRLERISPDIFNVPESASPWPLFAGPMGEDPHFKAGVELLRLGFTDSVASELLVVNRAGQPAEAMRLLVLVMALSGDERSAHAVARLALRRDLTGRITAQTRPVWEVAYPNAYRDLIEKHTAPAGVEPDLLQALMREESALDPKALSWAGALGLTQLMPSTAKAVAHQLNIKRFHVDSLLQPDLNIRLGAHYLGTLVKQFKGNTPYAVGSYNAGAAAVNRWRSDKPGQPLDAWVEEIPIAETRGYIKRVLRSYNTYQLLYGHAPHLPLLPSASR
ncbi:transglycosylase [Corallococcus sp. H22C18031201]|uniref:transglycosylase SLT domain-containing protein n=1 Tax=Citreicoccus inhibens TaxID=2849499 RepID=UPI000E754251|nr:transglycosylase SLT domain-containing protein [Citreicoccus inhibens]MBU8897390.1 transglycosylase SLT domain-containing protein [Citreicoccus inhibens]RJS16828.1 transglycosylase [Corallococcus sp. H22C18031201]